MDAKATSRLRGLVLGVGLAAGSPLLAQTPSSAQPPANPCPATNDSQSSAATGTNCAPTAPTVPSAPSAPASQRFPFPGDPAPAPATVPSTPGPQSQPQSNGTSPQAPASKRFPYPGDPDAIQGTSGGQNAPAPNGAPLQDAGSSGQSSSSSSSSSSSGSDSSSSSSSAHGDDDEGGSRKKDPDADDPAAIPRSRRHKLPPVPRQTPSQREQEDVQVAGFYFNDGNFKASYERAKDAVTLDAEDADAQFILGNAARKLGKLDEAEQAYKRCLDLDPVPKVRKPAEKALREMTGTG